MMIIFSINIINNFNKYYENDMKNIYAIVEIPIEKNK